MKRSRCRSSERGAIFIFVLVVLLVLIGISALAIDLGVYYAATQQTQDAADAAALAGAGKLREGMDPDAALQEAIKAAAHNSILKTPVTLSSADVQVGAWNATTRKVVAWDPTATGVAVQVTVRRTLGSSDGPLPTFFAKVWGKQYMETTRTSVAGLNVNIRPRNSVNIMVVQDASTSFQGAWSQAIDADTELLGLINRVCIENDAMGMVTFNASLSNSWLQGTYIPHTSTTYYTAYKPYLGLHTGDINMNTGIKYTTDANGGPVKTTDVGGVSSSGLVRPMVGSLTSYDPGNHTDIPSALDKASKLLKAGNAWGDTDTAVGLNYAIDALIARGGTGEKVIVLISDGMPHDVSGTYYTNLRKQAAITAANRAESNGIRIHTVTLSGTNGADFAFNEGLVRNGGYALRAADASKLRDLLISVGQIEVGHPYLLK